VTRLKGHVGIFKVGKQLFTHAGPKVIDMIRQKGQKVFLDLKFHDIPNTVYLASKSGTALSVNCIFTGKLCNAPVFMMTVHIKGGREMLRLAVRGAAEKAKELNVIKPFIVGVTRLTSDQADENIEKEVLVAARLAKDAGLDGVVCSALEAKKIRLELGKEFIIVTPGIRAKDAPVNDQKRTATAQEAIEAGANYIVVGRPIIEAKDPLKAVEDLIT
jgi:orotidine-5'-phosphate decarboxylase